MTTEKNWYDNQYDVCDFDFDFELNTDEQDNERTRQESKRFEDLENEFVCWKLENWQMFIENNWYGEMELYYRFTLHKERQEQREEQRQEIS